MLKLAQLNGLEKWPGGGAFAHPAGLTRGAFEQLFGTGGREFDRQKSKKSNAPGVARVGMLRLQIDRCIKCPVWSHHSLSSARLPVRKSQIKSLVFLLRLVPAPQASFPSRLSNLQILVRVVLFAAELIF